MPATLEDSLRSLLKERLRKDGCRVLLLDHIISPKSSQRLERVLGNAKIETILTAENSNLEKCDVVLIRPSMPVGQEVVSAAQAASYVADFRLRFPDALVGCVLPVVHDGSRVKAALDLVIRTLGLEVGPYEVISQDSCPSLADFVLHTVTDHAQLSVEKHRKNNFLWDKYLLHIDKSLRAGNSQTSLPYHFLVLSDREEHAFEACTTEGSEKVKLRSLDHILEGDDLSSCAAIFIDNDWYEISHKTALGNGIHTLRRIRAVLDAKGRSIPVIYQSGHSVSDFQDHEIKDIESLGAVLATKDIFPKVCKGRSIAAKEIEASRLARRDPRLSRYISQVYEFGSWNDEPLQVVCSKLVLDSDSCERELLDRLGMPTEFVYHKMYVLALFHTVMKDQLFNTKLKSSSTDFFDFDCIKSRAPVFADSLEPFRARYESIVADHRTFSPTTIIHGDAKWDNWFGYVLGDFGSVQPGREYKDVAKALLDADDSFKTARSCELRHRAVDAYLALRKYFDKTFSEDASTFKGRVEDMLLTESLRTLAYKADQDVASGLHDLVLSL